MLATRPWIDVAQFAAYACQCKNLHLKPCERPPCRMNSNGNHEAAHLLRQMLDLGISRWHPDPLAAIKAAKRNGAA